MKFICKEQCSTTLINLIKPDIREVAIHEQNEPILEEVNPAVVNMSEYNTYIQINKSKEASKIKSLSIAKRKWKYTSKISNNSILK